MSLSSELIPLTKTYFMIITASTVVEMSRMGKHLVILLLKLFRFCSLSQCSLENEETLKKQISNILTIYKCFVSELQ